MKTKNVFCLLFVAFLLLKGTCVYATPWNGATTAPGLLGTTYTVTTAEQLAWVAQQSQTDDFAGYTIRLEEDIDLGGAQETPPSWTPIGNAAHPFMGELDGNNHVIYNLYILNSFPSGAGLFAETGVSAVIHHTGLAQGQIMTDATSNVGGFIGINRGYLHHCFNMAQIIAHNGDNVGGLTGTNYGQIAYSYNTGIITDANNHVGGLAGVNKASAVLNECYNTGYCKGSDHAGALFGLNEAPASQLTRVYFDQQVTRTYVTGYGVNDVLDNTLYAVEKTGTFTSKNNPFNQLPEWNIIRDGYYRYPRLQCFGDHEAALVSVNCILLDADNLPVERAEGVGAPKEGNAPRKQFALSGASGSVWFSPSDEVIHIRSNSTAEVVRPCGNQEVILTVTEGSTTKQIYTIVKGYEKFDAGRMEGVKTACWREETKLISANHDGKEPLGGKDDEQGGVYGYQYMIIRDTVVYDEHMNPVSYTPMDTFYMEHEPYSNWNMPTDVSGTYAFRRYTHDYQCKTDWTESPGRVYMTVLGDFDAGKLYDKPDTLYGVLPITFTIESERDASGGAGIFSYLWKMKTEKETKNPLYIDGMPVNTASFNFTFEQPGTYVFTRRASDAMCSTSPIESETPHTVVVYEAIDPGTVDSFAMTLCNPKYYGSIEEKSPVSGGNGNYIYRWTCNGEAMLHSDTVSLPLNDFVMTNGSRYVFRRQVKDDSGLMDWLTSEGAVTLFADGLSDSCMAVCSQKKTVNVTVCMSDLPYTDTYTFIDGHAETYTLSEDNETVVMHDHTIDGCPMEVSIVCQASAVPVVDIQPVVDLCPSDSALTILFAVREGKPDRYDLVFPTDAQQAGFVSRTGETLPADGRIAVPMPQGVSAGTYYMSVVFYAGKGNGSCKSETYFFPFTLLTDGFVHRKWNDVVFVDSSDKNCEPDCDGDLQFTAYQWYKDGERVEGATGQYYHETGGLNGFYQVEMTGSDGTVYRSCVYEMRPTEGIDQVQRDDVRCTKVIRDGHLYLMVGEKIYSVYGQEIKGL